MDTMYDTIRSLPPTAERPLLGLTVLVVEDSRFASDAMRLLCLRSGARIRRADSLYAAERHLRTYRPGVVLVDMGLPDGSGADLVRSLAGASPRIDVILAMSGDDDQEAAAMAAGASAFLRKPILGLAAFQAAILRHLPAGRQPRGLRALSAEEVVPDPIAYRDDLSHAASVLASEGAAPRLDYVTQFLGGVARSAGDADVGAAVDAVRASRVEGRGAWPEIARLSAIVQSRLAGAAPIGPVDL